MIDRYVIIHRSFDPIQADHLGEILREGGILARVNGTRSGAAIGVGQNILEVHIAVPEGQAAQATDFLEAFFSGDGVAEPEFDGPAAAAEDEDEDEDRASGDAESLSPLLAVGAGFLTFGLAHVYARRPWTAAALAIGQLVALYFLFGGDAWSDWIVGAFMLGALVVMDATGAVLAVLAKRRGAVRCAMRQSAAGVILVSVALFFASAVGPQVAEPQQHRDRSAYDDGDYNTNGTNGSDYTSGEALENPLDRTPNLPGLTSEHPANPLR